MNRTFGDLPETGPRASPSEWKANIPPWARNGSKAASPEATVRIGNVRCRDANHRRRSLAVKNLDTSTPVAPNAEVAVRV